MTLLFLGKEETMMKKFIIENDFWEVFPDAKIAVVVCHDIDNTINRNEELANRLIEVESNALSYLTNDDFSSNDVIKVWREAYSKFKTKKGARSSIEALLKRVAKGNHIGNINPLVDIYNSISLKYALPCGGEDIDKFVSDLHLTKANGNEDFITYGTDLSEPPYEGEIIYKDNAGAVCRCWNWREAVRTCLDENTKNAFMIIESVDATRDSDLNAAITELSLLIKEYLGGTNTIHILDKENHEIVIED